MGEGQVQIQPFCSLDAPDVAGWVCDAQELLWLSPETGYPLTPEKVIAWGGPERRQFVFRDAPGGLVGYAELNDMSGRRDQQWIGHMLLKPAMRGRSIGAACVQALLDVAFRQLASEHVLLVVVPENERAIRCYLRAGFVHAGDEWKRNPQTNQSYRLLRMVIDRPRYFRQREAASFASISA